MTYNVRTYQESQDGDPGITVNDNQIDSTSFSVKLVGTKKKNYAQAFAENSIWQLGNFAYNSSPSAPVKGQLWFNTNVNKLQVYNGTDWVIPIDLREVDTNIVPITNDTYNIGASNKRFDSTYSNNTYTNSLVVRDFSSAASIKIYNSGVSVDPTCFLKLYNNVNGGLQLSTSLSGDSFLEIIDSSGSTTSKKFVSMTNLTGSISLHYNNASKLLTSSSGVTVTGKVVISDTLDITNMSNVKTLLSKESIIGKKFITDANLNDGSVHDDIISNLGIVAGKYAAGSINTDDIAPDAITSDKILNESVKEEHIDSNAINTQHLQENIILEKNIINGVVSEQKLSTAVQAKLNTLSSSPAPFNSTGNVGTIYFAQVGNGIFNLPDGWSYVAGVSPGEYTITHNLGSTNYNVHADAWQVSASFYYDVRVQNVLSNTFSIAIFYWNGYKRYADNASIAMITVTVLK